MDNDGLAFKECGTFTEHGFGFHAQVGTRTDFIIGYPYENDGWAVLTGSYDLDASSASPASSPSPRRTRTTRMCMGSRP